MPHYTGPKVLLSIETNEGGSLPYVRALRPSLPRNCLRQFLTPTHLLVGGSLPLAPNPRFSATPSAGWLCFFSAAVATLRRKLFPMPATPIKREFLRFFCFAKKWSLCDQVKTQRASGSLRHARNAHQRAGGSLRQIALPKKICKFFEKEFDKTKSLGLYYEKLETFPVTFPKLGCKQFFWRKI